MAILGRQRGPAFLVFLWGYWQELSDNIDKGWEKGEPEICVVTSLGQIVSGWSLSQDWSSEVIRKLPGGSFDSSQSVYQWDLLFLPSEVTQSKGVKCKNGDRVTRFFTFAGPREKSICLAKVASKSLLHAYEVHRVWQHGCTEGAEGLFTNTQFGTGGIMEPSKALLHLHSWWLSRRLTHPTWPI